MTAKNDITGDKLVSKTNTDKYRDGFAAIFNKCPICGKTGIHTCTSNETNNN